MARSFLYFYIVAIACIFIRPSFGIQPYIKTDIYPDTLEQCADYLVPIATAISYATPCINVFTGAGPATSSYSIACNNDTTYILLNFDGPNCNTPTNPPPQFVSFNENTCISTHNPIPNLYTPGVFNVIQFCKQSNPPPPDTLATMTITEYATPNCNNGLPDPTALVSTTTSKLNQCQNTGGASSFTIQCDPTSKSAYISNYTGYGCLSTKFVTTTPLIQLGCSSDGKNSIVVSCSSGSTPQPSNDIWTIITQSPYFIDGIAVCAGLLGGGFIVCLCICMCRRRNRKNRNKRPTSPSPYNTSLQPNAVVVDGIGTPLRSDVLPGLSTPSSQSQSNQGGIRTPLLSQSGGEERGFVDDDSEA